MVRIRHTIGIGVVAVCCLGGCGFFNRIAESPTGVSGSVESSAPTEAQQQTIVVATRAKESGNYDLALGLFQDILAENPTITVAYLGIGDIYMVKEEYARAEPAYARAARLEPRNFDAQYGHGLALHMLERFVEAIRAYHRALTILPDSVDVNLSIATSYLQINEVSTALVFAEKAVQLAPDNGAARSNLGAIYEIIGRNQDAIAQYLAAMELMPASPPLIMNLINVLAKERQYREVINAAENLLKLEVSANAYERMGYAYFRLAEYDHSLEAYRSAVMIDAGHWQSFNGIGVNALNKWLLSKKRDTDSAREARDAFRRSLQVRPGQQRVIALLSNYQL